MLIVLDTNVLVSGLLTPHGSPARVLDAVSTGRLSLAFDDRIVDEWQQVLSRPKFGFNPARVRVFVDSLISLGQHVVALPIQAELPNKDDLPFAEVAVTVGADAIVTGNGKHFVPIMGKLPITILAPKELVQILSETAPH